jgi:stage II sporulation protein AA (anti-sigma F factor antagonist)
MGLVDFGIDTTPTADGHGVVLAVYGDLDLATCEQLGRAAEDAIAGRRPLIVDLSDCPFLDSSGLRVMLQVHAALQDGNKPAVPMAVVTGNSTAGRLLSLTALDQRLSVFATRKEAAEWLSSEWKPNGKPGASSLRSTA